jgi:uncharacterized protein
MTETLLGKAGAIGLEPTFSSRLRFTCTRCGACCRHVGAGVGLTGDDLARLGKTAEARRPEHPIFAGALESEAGVCSQLSENDCTVYRARPLMCRLYPFYVGVKADGTLQLSVDHCPGVDLPDAELVDDGYVQREILPSLVEDPGYLESLRAQVMARKGGTCRIVMVPEVEVTWEARERLWRYLFSLLEERLPASFCPRDRFECLKADLVPWIEGRMIRTYAGEALDGRALERSTLDWEGEVSELMACSAGAQQEHRRLVQSEGSVTGDAGGEFTTFLTRTGESFKVITHEALKMREVTREAFEAEMAFLKEVVRREFVYQGVVVPTLTLREEASLLFYLADAAELMANAMAVRRGRERVEIDEMNSAICEADSHILTTVQELGVQVLTD